MELRVNHAMAQAVAGLVDSQSPLSHTDLTRLFASAKLATGDPGQRDPTGAPIGKRRRVVAVLTYAADEDPAAGGRLVGRLLAGMRGAGFFAKDGHWKLDPGAVENARGVMKAEGYLLDETGRIVPLVLDELGGRDLTVALRRYVERARAGVSDAALLAGTGKDLLEATARHVLVERGGSFNEHMPFPGTLLQALQSLGVAFDASKAVDARRVLSDAPAERLGEVLYLLGIVLNEMRNAEGTGHGRPFLPSLDDATAREATEAFGLLAGLLLARLDPDTGRP